MTNHPIENKFYLQDTTIKLIIFLFGPLIFIALIMPLLGLIFGDLLVWLRIVLVSIFGGLVIYATIRAFSFFKKNESKKGKALLLLSLICLIGVIVHYQGIPEHLFVKGYYTFFIKDIERNIDFTLNKKRPSAFIFLPYNNLSQLILKNMDPFESTIAYNTVSYYFDKMVIEKHDWEGSVVNAIFPFHGFHKREELIERESKKTKDIAYLRLINVDKETNEIFIPEGIKFREGQGHDSLPEIEVDKEGEWNYCSSTNKQYGLAMIKLINEGDNATILIIHLINSKDRDTRGTLMKEENNVEKSKLKLMNLFNSQERSPLLEEIKGTDVVWLTKCILIYKSFKSIVWLWLIGTSIILCLILFTIYSKLKPGRV